MSTGWPGFTSGPSWGGSASMAGPPRWVNPLCSELSVEVAQAM
ncbi:hypothetical protein SEA_KRADAL_185 [Streptomyces phage Kradal]|nr:hypothetical protein SEA_KRADAL_185 [Streptomyces phage Kradal]QPL14501.1 hypothetical protein SEA_EHYELIMAYOE_186 [Streptomyces phage EhyElimayoE]